MSAEAVCSGVKKKYQGSRIMLWIKSEEAENEKNPSAFFFFFLLTYSAFPLFLSRSDNIRLPGLPVSPRAFRLVARLQGREGLSLAGPSMGEISPSFIQF